MRSEERREERWADTEWAAVASIAVDTCQHSQQGKGNSICDQRIFYVVIKTLLGSQDFSDEEDILRYVIRATFVCLFKSVLCKLFMIKMRTKHNETNRTLPGLSG